MIIGVIGFIGSGKGTVSEYLTKRHGFKHDSFASSLKDACSVIFDWPRNLLEGDTDESRAWREEIDIWWADKLGIPNFSPRYALQLVGTDSLRNHFNPDIWFLTLTNRIRKSPDQSVVISDVRFPNEINFIKENKGILIQVVRGNNPNWLDIAERANMGDSGASQIMHLKYSHVHFSEWAWVGTDVDYVIENNGSVEDLTAQVDKIIERQ